jgi:starch-binding outer membrane protein, SusD/RagB family
MKKINFIIMILAGILITNSCTEKDLELTNPNQILPETFFKNEAQVQASVNAVYVHLQNNAHYGRLEFYMLDNLSQENGGNAQQEPDKVTYKNFTFDSSNGDISNYWISCYLGITKANFVIENATAINAIPESFLSQVKKNKFIAEARFLRANYYFMLVRRFGDLPLNTKLSPEALPRSPKAAVYDLMVQDLTFAAANLLPKGVEQKGRADKGAAQALLGKVLLYQKSYGPALAAFNSMSGYGLETNYFDNFMEETEHGIESVFEVEYNKGLGTGAIWNSPTSGQGLNEATFRGQDYGNLNWFNVYPSDNLLDSYEAGDKRFAGNFYVPGDLYNNGTSTMTVANFKENGGNTRRAAWKKYQNYYKRDSENFESGINVKVIRYADVLLMKAECENEVGTQATAIGYINEVRARAGIPALATTLTKDQVFKAIIQERKVELPGEQVRFDDILRWGLQSTELAGSNYQSKYALFPIPDSEISTNPKIEPADQNPGY